MINTIELLIRRADLHGMGPDQRLLCSAAAEIERLQREKSEETNAKMLWNKRAVDAEMQNDDHVREIAQLADELAFWAYQAKWYYAKCELAVDYDSLNRMRQVDIDMVFERARQAENQSRYNPEPPRDIGGT